MERLVRSIRHGSALPIWRRMVSVLAVMLAVAGLAALSQAAPSVTASIDPRSFAVDQDATLVLTVNEGNGGIDQLPEVEGLRFECRGQSSQHQMMNGTFSSSVSTVFQVQAQRPGTFTIPPLSITVDGRQLSTQALTVEVTPASVSPPSGSLGGADAEQPAFLRVSPVKQESFTGEVLPVEIRAYFRRGLRASLNSHPGLGGENFILTLSGKEPVQTEEMVDGDPYVVLTWSGTLSGIKEGRHKLSVAVAATVFIPDSRRRVPSVRDPFSGNDLFADFFNRQQVQEKKIQLVSSEMELQVLPLPVADRPEGFSGAIGRFELQVRAQPTDAGPGDPITLTMTVQGTGSFDRVEAPILSESEGWKIYSPTAKFAPGPGPGAGSKVFEQAVIAKGVEKQSLPPCVFSFFDPEARRYQTLRSEAIPLQGHAAEQAAPAVEADAGSSAPSKPVPATTSPAAAPAVHNSPPSTEASAQDPVPLHRQLGALQQEMVPFVERRWFQALVVILAALLVAGVILHLRVRQRAGDPERFRRQELSRLLDGRLRELEVLLGQERSLDFLALCRKAIQEQLGFYWQTGPEAITLADLHQRLPGNSVLTDLFARAENSVYGGGSQALDRREMEAYARQLDQELRQLR